VERHESEEMDDAECWRMLGTQSVGRIALSIAALPAILPVQYYIDGNEIAVCLGHNKLPQRSIDGAVVAFSSDFIDLADRSGWSVQVLGQATVPRPAGVPTDCGSSSAGQIVHLKPVTLKGYQLTLCSFMSTGTK
jgi:hypothetical protein